MKKIDEIGQFKSIDDFPETSAEFLDFLLEDEAFSKTEPHFTYEQMCDFALVFSQIHVKRMYAEMQQYLKEFEYSQKPLLHISDIKVRTEAKSFIENPETGDDLPF